ncbi:MAG: DUF2088 domain-containing protein [Caldilinea sp.]|nr:DUF2088 domain-containing protein [Caldilinea sp.]MCB9125810.1 DUF2088 domain-containing protein [Caldilineaceae bacterium]
MPILTQEAAGRALPRLLPVTQSFPRPRLDDPRAATQRMVSDRLAELNARSGARVAIGVGSRGIRDIVPVVQATVTACRDAGLAPCIVPAMGSHGGGTAEGQRSVLEHLGITEEAVGAPIVSSQDVTTIGVTESGIPVSFDRTALDADFIVPINRVKPHTDFAGTHESGLCKMLAIGFANHAGCSRIHQEGFARFHVVIPEVAGLILRTLPVAFGVAIVENAYDETCLIEAIPRAAILTREAELLQIAYANMARLYFDHIDVLVVEEIGKNISGAGMDPNIIGRTAGGLLPGFDGPAIRRIVVGALTAAGYGNAIGIGEADFTTERLAGQMDRMATYANAIAAGVPESARLPIVLPTLDDAVRAALQTCGLDDWSQAAIVRIKNTLHLDTILVSDALAGAVDAHPHLAWKQDT